MAGACPGEKPGCQDMLTDPYSYAGEKPGCQDMLTDPYSYGCQDMLTDPYSYYYGCQDMLTDPHSYYEDVQECWNEALDTVIIAGCAVLDINDYNNNYTGSGHTSSPGARWAATGVFTLLGYNYSAPHDNSGATAIIQNWLGQIQNAESDNETVAWALANETAHAWNACAIDDGGTSYSYFKTITVLGVPISHTWTSVEKQAGGW